MAWECKNGGKGGVKNFFIFKILVFTKAWSSEAGRDFLVLSSVWASRWKEERESAVVHLPQPHGNILSGDIPITPDRAVEFRESSKKESI